MTRDPRPVGAIGFRLLHELEGLITGIAADGVIVPEEVARVRRWLESADSFRTIHPFSELTARMDAALEDGVLSVDECEDILFVISNLTTVNPHFGAMRSGLQILMGILAGIAADGLVTKVEVAKLNRWLEDWRHLHGLWPFDDCEAVARSVANGGTTEGIAQVLALAAQFPIGGHGGPDDGPPMLVADVCALTPRLEFDGRRFVVTGESSRGTRRDLEAEIESRSGLTSKNVSGKSDYLVVCTCGSPFWAFSCYGRKIEKAYELQREGHPILIVHEADFWEALRAE